MKFKTQRIRNLTTGIVHTKLVDMYLDIDRITGSPIVTGRLGIALAELRPWLRKHIPDQQYWNVRRDLSHCGEVEIPAMSDNDKEQFRRRIWQHNRGRQ